MTVLRELVLEVPDVEAAAAFYGACGLREHERGTWEGGPFVVLRDAADFPLMLVEGDAGVRIAFTVDDASEALVRAENAGAVREGAPAPGGGGTWATATDPAGTPIGFWSRA